MYNINRMKNSKLVQERNQKIERRKMMKLKLLISFIGLVVTVTSCVVHKITRNHYLKKRKKGLFK